MLNVYLTFDVEDFIVERSMLTLSEIIDVLDSAKLKGLFFITGHFAEKLKSHPELISKLKKHEIGYHSSAHSVRPIITEYTDVPDYHASVEISFKRETSNISPITGEILGPGGFLALKKLFPQKKIVSFRAPGFAWSPTLLEALSKLGITNDFSTRLTKGPSFYRGIQFYPFPIVLCPPDGYPFSLKTLAMSLRRSFLNGTSVLLLHPTSLTYQEFWDSIFFNGNPPTVVPAKVRDFREERRLLNDFALFVQRIASLEKANIIKVTPPLQRTSTPLKPTKELVDKMYLDSIQWSVENFAYNPSFLYSHYLTFFGMK
jgi:hypothetical protein